MVAQKLVLSKRRNDWLLFGSIASTIILLSGILLYPETFSSLKIYLGPIRIIPLVLFFIISFPFLALYFYKHRQFIHISFTDYSLLLFVSFITVRGLLAVSNQNDVGLVLALASYTLLIYYGVSILAQNDKATQIILYTLNCLSY